MHRSAEPHDDSTPSGSDIPPGFSVLQRPDGRNYLVPNFLIDETNLAIKSEDMKRSLDVEHAQGGVSMHHSFHLLWCRWHLNQCRCFFGAGGI
jgi:hypothetical protein